MVKYPDASLDFVFGALADPTRRRILELLARAESRVTDLARSFSMSLPAVSKHLRVLEKAGLIVRRRDGRVHRLRIQAAPLEEASAWIAEYRRFWEDRFPPWRTIWRKTPKNRKTKHDDNNRRQSGSATDFSRFA